jgi:hypothetical protein
MQAFYDSVPDNKEKHQLRNRAQVNAMLQQFRQQTEK